MFRFTTTIELSREPVSLKKGPVCLALLLRDSFDRIGSEAVGIEHIAMQLDIIPSLPLATPRTALLLLT
jgi:hypothetical protein